MEQSRPWRRITVDARRRLGLAGDRIDGALGSRSNVDHLLAAHVARAGIDDLADPVAYVAFLRTCIEPLRLAVEVVREPPADNPWGHRFRRLCRLLGDGVPPVSLAGGAAHARLGDQLLADRTPLFGLDVAAHYRRSSSTGHKGRLLAAVVRIRRPATVLELGTAYGMSARFLLDELAALGEGGTLATVELAEEQHAIAAAHLGRDHGATVRCVLGSTADALPALLPTLGAVDVAFHDAAHSGEAYVEDFGLLLPHLAPGAMVLFDDIRWEHRDTSSSARTYDGWQEVAAHPRVLGAVELDDSCGLLVVGA